MISSRAPAETALPARPSGTETPFISVLVPVRNEAAFLERILVGLLSQDYPGERFEVLVADGRSTDETPEIVRRLQRRYANLRLVENPKQLSSAGRNAALREALGEVIVVVDGHCRMESTSYLASLARVFQQTGADCVGRPQPLDVPDPNGWQEAIAAARSSWLGHQPASYIYAATEGFAPPQSVAVAYRRSVFETVGFFDEEFDACEDVEFNHRVARAGLRCYFTPRAALRYYPRDTIFGLFRQMMRYGRGRVRLFRKWPETFSWACFLPALGVLGLVIGAILSGWSAGVALAYGASLALYGLVLLSAGIGLAVARRRFAFVWRLPIVWMAIHFGAGCGILAEWVRR